MEWHPEYSVFQGNNARSLYFRQVSTLASSGAYVTKTRGRETREILNVLTVINNPKQMCVLIPERKWNPWLALSESLWVLAGKNTIDELVPYNKYITDYSDDGKTLYGAYGYRIADQLAPLVNRLQNDPGDRRAVLSIWHPVDLIAPTKDPPCNDMVMFKLRDGKLHMTVINRSNDIHWGLYAVNIPEFAMLQLCIAAVLGVQVGTQTHLSNSLHYYTDEPRAKSITARMLRSSLSFGSYPNSEELFPSGLSIDRWKNWAERILTGQSSSLTTPFGIFSEHFLRFYRNDKDPMMLDKLPFAESFPDWIEAGKMFLQP